MKKITILLFLIAGLTFSQEPVQTISGTVTNAQTPLKDVSIFIQGKSLGTSTDADGRYTILARPRDILVYSYVGMQPVEIIIEDVSRILNITLLPKVEELDEVVVTKSKRKTQKQLLLEYKTNKNIINSNFGLIDKEATALYLRTLNGNELNPAALDLPSAINGKFAGIEGISWVNSTTNNQVEPAIYVRRKGRLVFEVDGMFTTKVPEIDVSQIERIGVIVGTIAARRYGSNAAGVMIINTKMAKNGLTEDGGLPYDRAKLRSNIFENNAIAGEAILRSKPLYVQELYGADNYEMAMEVYQAYAQKYGNSYYFFLDAYQYFSSKTDNQDFADSIINQNWGLFENNPVALKSLAYLYQAEKAYDKTNKLYREIFIIRPNYAQSYMDLANSYRETDNFQKAAAIFARYDYLVEQDLLNVNDSTPFAKMMDRALNNLMVLKGKEILSKKALRDYVLEEELEGTRLVFEWSDSEAEFELQFVNPDGHYFSWLHSLEVDSERIKNEKLIGFSCEEFSIDDALPGLWQVNVKYLGNKSLTPTYLKASIYYNYGSQSQQKETKVFRLGLKNVNQELFKLNNVDSMTSH